MSVTCGFPIVIVPVLSKTIALILCAVSKASPLLIKIPFSAPFPVATIIAVGVARPSAHGQAITRTETKIVRANAKLSPLINHKRAAIKAITNTMGTKYPETVSAIFAIGALRP